jgi:hypothetical protein
MNSRPIAERRLHLMEKEMDKDPDFAAAFMKKIVEYNERGYIRKLSSDGTTVTTQEHGICPILLLSTRTSQENRD